MRHAIGRVQPAGLIERTTRWLRDAAIGLAIGVLVFLFFVRFLNVNLPAGWLLPVLGAAGT